MSINEVLSGARSWHVETTDVLAGLRSLPDACVHCCVTSPPYYGLRDYGVDGQIGLEATPEAFVARLVEVFREVRRVLRPDATFWLNIGDSYNSAGGERAYGSSDNATGRGPGTRRTDTASSGLKPKDRLGIPHRVVFALQADGWWWRDEIIWHKRAPMPESVQDRTTKAHEPVFLFSKEEMTDHEYLFLMARSGRYFYDNVSSAEESIYADSGIQSAARGDFSGKTLAIEGREAFKAITETRNMRSVWTLSPESFRGAHFATMPTELPRRCLLAGTSEKGCCAKCGAPRVRVTEKERRPTRPGEKTKVEGRNSRMHVSRDPAHPTELNGKARADGLEVGERDPQRHVTSTVTTGWKDGCKCEADTLPCLVLDPFNGAATTGVVARRLGLRYIGFELNPEYAAMSRKRILDDAPLMNAIAYPYSTTESSHERARPSDRD